MHPNATKGMQMHQQFRQAEQAHEERIYALAALDDETLTYSGTLDGTDCDLIVCKHSLQVVQVSLSDSTTLDAELFCKGIRDSLQQQANDAMRDERERAEADAADERDWARAA